MDYTAFQNKMKKIKISGILISIALMIIVSGCGPELPTEEKIEMFTFSDATINYSHREKIIHLHVHILSLNDIDSVSVQVTEPNDSLRLCILNDSGTNGDIISGDDVYSFSYTYTFPDSVSGVLKGEFQVLDVLGNTSDIYRLFTDFLVVNQAPLMLEIDTPDSMALPASGYKLLTLKAYVDDPDGIEDIVTVNYEVWSIQDSNWISYPTSILADIDSLNLNIEQDGFFTSTVQFTSENKPVMNVFRYTAKDSYGNFSESMLDSIQMYFPDGGKR